MHAGKIVNERTSLTRPSRSPDYVEFTSLLRKRKTRVRQFQCCVCATFIAIFTMALIATVSYSVSHDIVDVAPNLTAQLSPSSLNLTRPLKLGLASGSGSYTLFSDPSSIDTLPNSIFVTEKRSAQTALTDDEIKDGLEAGRQAINDRLFADATALMSPLPSPSPESRHRYAVSTCASVGRLALAAIAEIAATKRIESSRAIVGASSAAGSFFDGGWESQGVCKQLSTVDCPADKYRTFDGSCNRPMQRGASMTPFKRLLPPSYADGVELPRKAQSGSELPSAREVSLKVHKPSPSSNPRFTVMLAVYGQFLDHDVTATAISQGINGSSISCCPPSVGHPECFPVPVSRGDPVFDVTGRDCMDFVRSAPAPQCKLGPRQQLNQVTAFIDGSAVYGSDPGTARDLREFAGGRLRMQRTPDNRTLLPASTNPNDGCNRETERLRGRYCFAAGDARANENLHLTTMHLLWARQHNRIAEELAKRNPSWDDETLYQESRRIVGAQLQHITYQEFLPIVLGEQETGLRDLRPLSFGHRDWTDDPNDPNGDPSIANSFAAAAFRFAHTLLPGLMKVTNEQQGTSSYVELHRMLFNPYSLYAEGGVKSSVTTATGNTIQMTSTHVTSQLTNHLFEDPIASVTVPCGLDLVSLNIQRGRDHGLPGYTKWREYCGLGKVSDFSDLAGHIDSQALQEIANLYESVHDIDLYTGALAELPKTGGIVGPTFSCLIADQFVRLRKGDRFWYELAAQPHSFTEDQLAELRKTSLARLICDCSDGVTQTQAEVMRSIGPDNPMITCEDIPTPSFEPWKENRPTPILQASMMPVNWTALKNDINNTIRDVVTYINGTKASATLDTDWLAVMDYINNTFFVLRNQLADLHPSKVSKDTDVPKEKLSMDSGSFILRAAGPGNVYQDWIAFKSDLVKFLNDSIGTMGGGPAIVDKWMTFRQNIVDHLVDLKEQVSSLKADVEPKLEAMKAEWQQMAMNRNAPIEMQSIKDVMIPAVFDWKNFKANVISSLDETIMNIGANMPSPGDPAWASFVDDIKDRFVAFRDKIDSQKSAAAPVELATGKVDDLSDDWLANRAEAIKAINDAVNKIENEMPPPGDPAWATYRDEITKSFSALKNTPSPLKLASSAGTSDNLISQRGRLAASTPDKLNNLEFSNLTNNWAEFRAEINDTLTKFLESIKNKKPMTIDPVAWSAFKVSVMNDMAKFKDEIAGISAEWRAGATSPKDSQKTIPKLQATLAKSINYSNFDYTKFFKPAIPPDEWADFKRAINDTVMNILNTANSTEEIDYDKFGVTFGKSFAELKNQISSLRNMIDDAYNNKTTVDWISFQTQLNSTVKNLEDGLSNEKLLTSGNLMSILFETKERMSDLRPPTNLVVIPPAEWMRYTSKINKTISDSLKSVNDQKYAVSMLRAAVPLTSSSDDPKEFCDWLIISSLVGSFHVFTMISRYQIRL